MYAPLIGGFFSDKKIHKSFFSGGYEGRKHGDLKILLVFYLYKA